MNRHPLSALFAQYDLAGEDLKTLAEDIQSNGLHLPITTHGGMILDGWNRFQACQLAKVRPIFISLAPGLDPWEFVKGANMLRRHMSPAERVAVMLLKCRMDEHSRMNECSDNQQVQNCTPPPTVKEIAKDLEISQGTAQKAAQVSRANDPALEKALSEKRVSLDRAAELAKMPAPERRAELESPTPKPMPKPEASEDVAALKARITELEEQNQELAQLMKDTMEENDSMHRIMDAEDLQAQFKAEVARFMELARVTTARNNALISEVNDLKHFAKMWRGKYETLAAANKAAGMEVPA